MIKVLNSVLFIFVLLIISCDFDRSKSSYSNSSNQKDNKEKTSKQEKVKYSVVKKISENGYNNYDILLLESKKDKNSLVDFAKTIKGELCSSEKCNLMFYDNEKAATLDRELTNMKNSGNLKKYNNMLNKHEKFISDHMIMYVSITSDDPVCCYPFK